MATEEHDDGGLTFYPAFCHKASPTHFAWVKMSAADVHRLKTRRGFEGRYFALHCRAITCVEFLFAVVVLIFFLAYLPTLSFHRL